MNKSGIPIKKEENEMKRFKAYVNYLMNFYANYFRIYRYM